MAVESFLINPVKRRKTKSRGLRSRRSGKIKANYWKGDPKGHRKAALKGWRRRVQGVSGMAHPLGGTFPCWNPLGEEVMIVGANPRRRRKIIRKRRRHNPLSLLAGDRAVARYRRRRNPVTRGLSGSIDINKPTTLLYPIAVGVASKMATERIPGMLRITEPVTRYGIQLAIGIGGGMLLSNVVGRTNAAVWGVVSGVTILVDMLDRFVFRPTLGYIEEGEEDLLTNENYPALAQDDEQIEAFPEEVVADEYGLEAFPNELGAFPYEGSPAY